MRMLLKRGNHHLFKQVAKSAIQQVFAEVFTQCFASYIFTIEAYDCTIGAYDYIIKGCDCTIVGFDSKLIFRSTGD